MARDFSKNASHRMPLGVSSVGSLINGAAGISFHGWANADSFDNAGAFNNALVNVFIGTEGTGFTLRVDATGANALLRVVGRSVRTESIQFRNATSAFTTGVWHSCGGVVDIAGDTITPYFNGAAENSGAATFANACHVG